MYIGFIKIYLSCIEIIPKRENTVKKYIYISTLGEKLIDTSKHFYRILLPLIALWLLLSKLVKFNIL